MTVVETLASLAALDKIVAELAAELVLVPENRRLVERLTAIRAELARCQAAVRAVRTR